MRLIDRATFNWGSEIQDLFVFALLLPEVGPKNSYHFLYQSEAKLKPITAWSSAFSRLHLTQLGCVTERCHWLLKVHVLSFLLIGCYDYWFYDTQSKRSLNSSVWSQFWKNSKFWNSKTLFFKENNDIYFWTHHSFKNFPKNNMFAIQPASFYSCDKELWAIGIFTSISHTQPAWTIMLQLKVLIIKSITIYAFTWLIGK